MKKITRATVKSFIKKNQGSLYINVKGQFDGMTDGIESRNAGFVKATVDPDYRCQINTLGIAGLWLVGGDDRYSAYDDSVFEGIAYYNCCGNGVLAIQK